MTELALQNPAVASTSNPARYAVPVGRALYALLFIIAGLGHFSSQTVAYAASTGLPYASFLVPASGALAIAGGLSIALGYRAKLGAAALIAFLVPVTLTMHAFWAAPDAMTRMIQQTMFFKNMALLGAALFITYFGAGPISLDARRRAAN